MFSIVYYSSVLDSGPIVIWEGPNIVSHVVRRQHDIMLYRLMTLEARTGPPKVVCHVVRRQHDIMYDFGAVPKSYMMSYDVNMTSCTTLGRAASQCHQSGQHDIMLSRLMTLGALTGRPKVVCHVVRCQHDIM